MSNFMGKKLKKDRPRSLEHPSLSSRTISSPHRGFKTMYRALFLALAAPAVAFVPPAQLPAQSARVAARSAVSMADSVEMSESLPMLPRPMKLKGWTGDVGFDPLGLSVRALQSDSRPAHRRHRRAPA